MSTIRATVLALDLEGTLISNAVSQIPRAHLYNFLCRCRELFPRLVMFTTVKEERFRRIAKDLVKEGLAPAWFSDVEYIHWEGKTKNLSFIPDSQIDSVLLVDDYQDYVHPEQESQWMQISCFEYPYHDDAVLLEMAIRLEQRLNEAKI